MAEKLTKTPTPLELVDTVNDIIDDKLDKTGTAAAASTLTGLTATVAELNYTDGVTSNIQTQLDNKLATSGTATKATQLATARTIDGVSFNGTTAITHYGTCSTAAATAAKTVSLTGFSLVTGARVLVKFTVTNTAANPTLNVNSTGAKAIMYRGSAISAGYLAANRVYEFVYDGTDYEFIGDYNTNTTYSNMTAATSSADGKAGLVPAPAAGEQASFLRGDGTWATPSSSGITLSSNVTVTGSTQSAITPSASGGTFYGTSSGAKTLVVPATSTGVSAGTYTLQNIIQNLVTKSHSHSSKSLTYMTGSTANCSNYNCNCNCSSDS